MGLRDTLKAKVKGLLGAPPAAPSAVPAATPQAKPAASPNAAPVAKAQVAAPQVPESAAAPAWSSVAPAGKVTDEKPGTYAHGRYNVSVFRRQGKLYAMDDACAHEDGPLGEGALDGNCVVCPYHDWRYDFTTGACLTEPDRERATFAVKEESGQLWLGERLTRGSDSRGGDHDDGMEVIRK